MTNFEAALRYAKPMPSAKRALQALAPTGVNAKLVTSDEEHELDEGQFGYGVDNEYAIACLYVDHPLVGRSWTFLPSSEMLAHLGASALDARRVKLGMDPLSHIQVGTWYVPRSPDRCLFCEEEGDDHISVDVVKVPTPYEDDDRTVTWPLCNVHMEAWMELVGTRTPTKGEMHQHYVSSPLNLKRTRLHEALDNKAKRL